MIEVLIADDEMWVAEVIKNLIDWEAMGFTITGIINDGEEALNTILSQKPRLVLTDIRMPGMEGLDIIRRVKNAGQDTLFVIISGYSDFDYARTALSYGAVGYLLKPIDQGELESVLRRSRDIIERNEETKKMDQLLRKDLDQKTDRLKEQYFLGVFRETSGALLSREQVNREFGLNFTSDLFRVAIFAVSGVKNVEDRMEKAYKGLWELDFPVLCEELVTLRYRKNLCILYNYKESGRKMTEECLAKLFSRLTAGRGEGDITLAFGPQVRQFSQIRESYQGAKRLLGVRLALGVNRVYYGEEVTTGELELGTGIDPRLESGLKQALELMDEDTVLTQIRSILHALSRGSRYQPYRAARGILRMAELFSTFDRACHIKGDEHKSYFTEKLDELEECVTVTQAEKVFEDMTKDLLDLNRKLCTNKNQKLIQTVIKYIDENYGREVSLIEVSDLVHLNPNYFCDVFKKETGKTFKEYCIEKRIEVAKELLKDCTVKMNEISEQVGYKDPKHFSRQFKKLVGVNPTEYRRLFI